MKVLRKLWLLRWKASAVLLSNVVLEVDKVALRRQPPTATIAVALGRLHVSVPDANGASIGRGSEAQHSACTQLQSLDSRI